MEAIGRLEPDAAIPKLMLLGRKARSGEVRSAAFRVLGAYDKSERRVDVVWFLLGRVSAAGEADGVALGSTPLTAQSVASADCVVIATDHSNLDYEMIRANARRVVDTRNALKRNASS